MVDQLTKLLGRSTRVTPTFCLECTARRAAIELAPWEILPRDLSWPLETKKDAPHLGAQAWPKVAGQFQLISFTIIRRCFSWGQCVTVVLRYRLSRSLVWLHLS